jgi:hypothetical protein
MFLGLTSLEIRERFAVSKSGSGGKAQLGRAQELLSGENLKNFNGFTVTL